MLIKKHDGSPFANMNTAKSFATRQGIKDYEVVALGDGSVYALKVADDYKKVKSEDTDNTTNEIDNIEDVDEEPIITAPVKKAKATKPINVEVSKPWRPANVNDIPKDCKDPNRVYRFGNKHDKLNMDRKLRSQWIVDHVVAKKLAAKGLLFANGSCDTTLLIGDLILLSMDKETEKSRKKYYADLNNPGRAKQKMEQACSENSDYNQSMVTGDVKVEKLQVSAA